VWGGRGRGESKYVLALNATCMHVDVSFSYLCSAVTASFDIKEFHRNCTHPVHSKMITSRPSKMITFTPWKMITSSTLEYDNIQAFKNDSIYTMKNDNIKELKNDNFYTMKNDNILHTWKW
jgi:hypothetical protein